MACTTNFKMSSVQTTSMILLLAFSGFLITVEGSTFHGTNNCDVDLTIFIMDPQLGVEELVLPAHVNFNFLGIPSPSWVGGVMWASANGDSDYTKATQLTFNINNPQSPTLDYYSISTKSGYNFAAQISLITIANGLTVDGVQCGTIQSPNTDGVVYHCSTGSFYSIQWC